MYVGYTVLHFLQLRLQFNHESSGDLLGGDVHIFHTISGMYIKEVCIEGEGWEIRKKVRDFLQTVNASLFTICTNTYGFSPSHTCACEEYVYTYTQEC